MNWQFNIALKKIKGVMTWAKVTSLVCRY